jgi:hypothetical protein
MPRSTLRFGRWQESQGRTDRFRIFFEKTSLAEMIEDFQNEGNFPSVPSFRPQFPPSFQDVAISSVCDYKATIAMLFQENQDERG